MIWSEMLEFGIGMKIAGHYFSVSPNRLLQAPKWVTCKGEHTAKP